MLSLRPGNIFMLSFLFQPFSYTHPVLWDFSRFPLSFNQIMFTKCKNETKWTNLFAEESRQNFFKARIVVDEALSQETGKKNWLHEHGSKKKSK